MRMKDRATVRESERAREQETRKERERVIPPFFVISFSISVFSKFLYYFVFFIYSFILYIFKLTYLPVYI